MLGVGFFLLGLAAWLVAVFGPPFLGLWFWRAANERFVPWVAHVLFLPTAVFTEWVATRAIFFAAHDDGSGPPGLGLALMLPLAMFLGAVVIYYAAVTWTVIRAVWRRATVR